MYSINCNSTSLRIDRSTPTPLRFQSTLLINERAHSAVLHSLHFFVVLFIKAVSTDAFAARLAEVDVLAVEAVIEGVADA